MSSIAVLVLSVVLILKQKTEIVGKASIAIQIVQAIALVIFLQ